MHIQGAVSALSWVMRTKYVDVHWTCRNILHISGPVGCGDRTMVAIQITRQNGVTARNHGNPTKNVSTVTPLPRDLNGPCSVHLWVAYMKTLPRELLRWRTIRANLVTFILRGRQQLALMEQCRWRGGRRGMREVQREIGKMAEKNKTSK